MLEKASGILLHTTNYSDSSVIVKVYSSRFGLQSYMVSGVHGKRTKNKASVLQPMNIVEFIATGGEKSKMKRITEIGLLHPYTSIPYDITKSTIVMFLNELLFRSLKDDEPNGDLFEYLKNALLILDLRPEGYSNFHLCFALQLSRFLGFYPRGNYSPDHTWFDLRDGTFVASRPSHALCMENEDSRLFDLLLHTNFEDMDQLNISRGQRKKLLRNIVFFYRLHIPSFGEMRSTEVLEEIIS
jgi:DNA repair protein RecO (recombination protein O)